MPNYYEDCLHPEDYIRWASLRDIRISKPPLINTSLGELAEAGWNLHIEARRIVRSGGSKVILRFRPPDGTAPGLNFKIWYDGYVGSYNQAVTLLSKLESFSPKNLTEKAAAVEERIHYQEVVYPTVDPVTFEPREESVRLPLIDMIMDHPNLEMFESEILERINERRAERIQLPSEAPADREMPTDLTEYFERVFSTVLTEIELT